MARLTPAEIVGILFGLWLLASAAHGTNTISNDTKETDPCSATQTPCPTARP